MAGSVTATHLPERFVFEQVLERCVRKGWWVVEGFAIDASLVKADANRQAGARR